MEAGSFGIWQLVEALGHVTGGIAATLAAVWIAGRRERFGPAGTAIVVALGLTGLWSLASAAVAGVEGAAALFETARNLAWLFAIYRLFTGDGRHASLRPIRPLIASLGFVAMLQLGLTLISPMLAGDENTAALFHLGALFSLMVATGGLVLAHNLYVGASAQMRLSLRWPALGLAVLWGFDLNFYTIAFLGDALPAELAGFRGLVVAIQAALLALGAAREREALRFRPSRAVTFQSLSLLLIGVYLVAMVAIAQWLAFAGGDFARLMGFGFLIAASVGAMLVLPSRRLRGWTKVTLAKHLFQHRYDYRAEWLRFTSTIGNHADQAQPLEQRVVQALADIADSPAGLLLACDDQSRLELAARWQWPVAEVPAPAMSAEAVRFFESGSFIVDLDDWRAGRDERGEALVLPEWLREETRAWALVPLLHYERLVGLVVLARPQHVRKFDWEDFDLLRVVGQQLASYLAEHAGQSALAEAARFDDFHRRIAFVMHDIKNLASQLSLLARNAEIHADKPAFRDDMLLTLRNSADKLNALLARLSRYGGGAIERLESVQAGEVLDNVMAQFRSSNHAVTITESHGCTVSANRESLEQVLVHLVQNAVDASLDDGPVFLALTSDGKQARIEVVDTGSGMSPEFVRTRLFKPFDSSKAGGFGIGAFEARELVRAMRGTLDVESREGLGSRFSIWLPLAEPNTNIAADAAGIADETKAA